MYRSFETIAQLGGFEAPLRIHTLFQTAALNLREEDLKVRSIEEYGMDVEKLMQLTGKDSFAVEQPRSAPQLFGARCRQCTEY